MHHLILGPVDDGRKQQCTRAHIPLDAELSSAACRTLRPLQICNEIVKVIPCVFQILLRPHPLLMIPYRLGLRCAKFRLGVPQFQFQHRTTLAKIIDVQLQLGDYNFKLLAFFCDSFHKYCDCCSDSINR